MRYAGEQRVSSAAVSDGYMLYAADIQHGGLRDRIFVSLEDESPPEPLWWLSVHGIYRECELGPGAAPVILPDSPASDEGGSVPPGESLIHSKYKIPARCFAYVGDAANPSSWKLPFRLLDGSPDVRRLPKAIQAILSNYRGTKVGAIPESAIPDVLVRLARAAHGLGKMPGQSGSPAAIYVQLEEVLRQLNRLEEVVNVGQEAGLSD